MEINETIINFATVGGTYFDFADLDLTPWGIKGGFVESEGTEKFIRDNSIPTDADTNWELVKNVSQSAGGIDSVGMHGDWKYMTLLSPLDINNPPSANDYFEAIGAIKVIHPSELYIRNILEAQYFAGGGIRFNGWITYTPYHGHKYRQPTKHYFNYPKRYIQETNDFLVFYKKNYQNRDYIRNAIKYYLDSFNVNSVEMSFICLCICLETIVPGKEQLSYRFRRNLAVLLGEDYERATKIYKNAKSLYDYRSTLVHSGMTSKDFEKFEQFFEYAQILASRMIIEMLLHNIPSIKDLDKRLTELGFGEGNTITKNYKGFQGNILTWDKVSEYEFQ